MGMVETLKNQHADLLRLSESILSVVHTDEMTADAATIRTPLLPLFGRVTVHLATEDEHVYPILARHVDGLVDATEGFFTET